MNRSHFLCMAGAAALGVMAGCAAAPGPGDEDRIGPLSGQQMTSGPAVPRSPLAPEPPPAPPAPLPSSGPIEVGVTDAILLALEHNRQLAVQRLNPEIRRTFESEQRAAFDPDLTASLARTWQQLLERSGEEGRVRTRDDLTTGSVALTERLPTGATVAAGISGSQETVRPGADPLAQARAGLSVTQSLLRGLGLGPNLASLRQTRLDVLSSQYELRGFAEALVDSVEQAYWNVALAELRVTIFTNSLALAEQQQRDTEDRIRVGTLAKTEAAAAQAEVARRREDLINARSDLAAARLQLLRLLNPPGGLTREVVIRTRPFAPAFEPDDVETHVQLALKQRPDLNQARLAVQRGDLEIVKTRNGLLPQLDLFITLGKSGYADSFGSAAGHIAGPDYDVAASVNFESPLGNRAAQARHRRATLGRTQALEALDNLAQLVEVDVRSAWIEVTRAREQVAATTATRKLQEEALRAETEKFRVGRSTSLLVAQAQRDLVASQTTEAQAVVNYLNAMTALYRLEGTLLDRRGIAAPGEGGP